MSKTPQILVIEDEFLIRNMLGEILVQEGFSVMLASGADDALKSLAEKPFDLILSDVRMPKVDGFKLLQKLKRQYPHLGIIVMTGYSDAYTRNEALHLGADEYIAKPFNIPEIIKLIHKTYKKVLSSRLQN